LPDAENLGREVGRVMLKGFCPHCGAGVQFKPLRIFGASTSASQQFETAPGRMASVTAWQCPVCDRPVLRMVEQVAGGGPPIGRPPPRAALLYPRSTGRPPVPPEVPDHIREDYEEAALVADLSPKASAALSRRCLQTILTEAGKSTKYKLFDQIEEVAPQLPAYLAEQLHGIRIAGNFAAHPKKNTATGEIIPVEPDEAEYNLDVLELLFDHYYVKPAKANAIKMRLEQKDQSTRKP